MGMRWQRQRRSARQALTAGLALAAVLAAAACGGSADAGRAAGGADDPTASTGGRLSAPAEVADAFDPEHAVAAPGPLKLPLLSADLLVVDDRTIGDDELARLRKVPGVREVTPLSIASLAIEDRALTVAAVDPDTYRRSTQVQVAQATAIWKRLAGGEIFVSPALRDTLPITDDGYLQLGPDDPTPHIGAFAPQVPSVDLVVDEAWGRTLGMTPGNAVLISTGMAAPDRVRRGIARIVPAGSSIQGLDAVARYGLDPDAVQTAVVVGGVSDAVGTYSYRVVGGRVVPDAGWVASHIATEPVPILGSMTCNTAIFPQLRAALEEIVQRGLASKIHVGEYAGCFYPRFIAGTTTLSNHAFGLAFDLNVPGNQRGTVGEMDRTVVSIFKKWGFAWGGDWSYTDPMHFELARLVRPD
ncbi:hypothetical protein GCM10022215_31240 [Nocardioides fonticola]|uniref:Peptidase M15C domain-containing protein n=1 Tax=Nocardioides fonticola TaxID=450363 RepID=A0ABP7XQW3_9ACTN